jgi:hypothetical protein
MRVGVLAALEADQLQQLARNRTFAKLAIFPAQDAEEQGALGATHVSALAPSRVRVDIEKLIADDAEGGGAAGGGGGSAAKK